MDLPPYLRCSPPPRCQSASSCLHGLPSHLFHAHVGALRAKHLAGLHALFTAHAPALDTRFSALPVATLVSAMPTTKLGLDVRALETEFERWQRERTQAARRAFDDGPWPGTPAPERAALLRRLADRLAADKDEVARLESLDTGKRFVESQIDVDDIVSVFGHFADLAAADAGRVVEHGTHDELVDRPGPYADLWAVQTGDLTTERTGA